MFKHIRSYINVYENESLKIEKVRMYIEKMRLIKLKQLEKLPLSSTRIGKVEARFLDSLYLSIYLVNFESMSC